MISPVTAPIKKLNPFLRRVGEFVQEGLDAVADFGEEICGADSIGDPVVEAQNHVYKSPESDSAAGKRNGFIERLADEKGAYGGRGDDRYPESHPRSSHI